MHNKLFKQKQQRRQQQQQQTTFHRCWRQLRKKSAAYEWRQHRSAEHVFVRWLHLPATMHCWHRLKSTMGKTENQKRQQQQLQDFCNTPAEYYFQTPKDVTASCSLPPPMEMMMTMLMCGLYIKWFISVGALIRNVENQKKQQQQQHKRQLHNISNEEKVNRSAATFLLCVCVFFSFIVSFLSFPSLLAWFSLIRICTRRRLLLYSQRFQITAR